MSGVSSQRASRTIGDHDHQPVSEHIVIKRAEKLGPEKRSKPLIRHQGELIFTDGFFPHDPLQHESVMSSRRSLLLENQKPVNKQPGIRPLTGSRLFCQYLSLFKKNFR